MVDEILGQRKAMDTCMPIVKNTTTGVELEQRPKRAGWVVGAVLCVGLLFVILLPVRKSIRELWEHPPTQSELVKMLIGGAEWEDMWLSEGVFFMNAMLYVMLARLYCRASDRTLERLGNTFIGLAGGTDMWHYAPGNRGEHWRNFCLLFVLPMLVGAAGVGEYHLLKYLLHRQLPSL
jgi:hypothetical protein